MPPNPADASEQPTLRVMRLYKPRLETCKVLPNGTAGSARAPATAEGIPVASTLDVESNTAGEGDFALGSSLKLPDSFGNIYLGETFTAYISVLNHLQGTILVNASLSAKLQSPRSRVELEDMRTARGTSVPRKNPTPVLHPTENLDMIVEHSLEDLGDHTLRVTVKYRIAGAPEGSEPMTLRKFYRFKVTNPVTMSALCPSIRGQPFVEMLLRNTTQMDLLLESCEFIPEAGFAASLVGGDPSICPSAAEEDDEEDDPGDSGGTTGDNQGEGRRQQQQQQGLVTGAALRTGVARRVKRGPFWWERGFGHGKDASRELGGGDSGYRDESAETALERYDRTVSLRPGETYQLVYSVRSVRREEDEEERILPGSSGDLGDDDVFPGVLRRVAPASKGFEEGTLTLGQVELCWRTTMGESGSVVSAPVVYEAPSRPEVEVTVEGLPDVLTLRRVVECFATVHNRSRRPMTLQLQFTTDGMSGVYVHGQSFRNLGELAPGTSVRCPLQLLALVAGLHELRGCTVADMHTAQEFPQGKLRDVLVEFPPDDSGGKHGAEEK